MASEATTVTAYIAEAPADRRPALNLLRRLCREDLPGFAEAMKHGMPSYLRGGEIEVAFASQKSYISVYILRQAVLEANADRFTGLSVGKGAIRFRRPEQIDPETVRALLGATVADDGQIC
jgi:uncharacterized protein YdhG (YjbR/CyaY superfamily)